VITPWSRVLLAKVMATQLVKKLLAFLKSEVTLPCSKGAATGPYPEAFETCPHSLKLLLYDPF
jgi:hypothetical protein